MIVSKRYISDTSFYKKVLAISLPIMVQSGITGFVSMLDNLMIGTLGTEAMTGVSITNQLIMIFNYFCMSSLNAFLIKTVNCISLCNKAFVRKLAFNSFDFHTN